ncbi:MAG TPA: serine/threonine-protein kinase [Gemmatimonadaceae bacterium]|nr:serine/threonine-protein kinase [Gemmatimonadaceae bacterium]
MTTRRDDRIDELFEQALLRPPDERSGWLSAECGDDAALRDEVAELLEAHALDRGILDRPPPRPAGSGATERRIGAYRVVQELGRGGMGVVYLAERDDGQFTRRVAVKLLRASPDAEELHRRFVAERQILASLVHPHIAQLLDGGVTDGRLPYLVMEYVEGMPITEYCDRQRLTIEERLRLFLDVCAAVHHAHQNLVIHRDLKPGNIMVTEGGRVKLLDFGIAKLLNPGMSAVSVPVTRTELRIMTPEYASPEQVRGDPLSTASDVYALGVVLYELLAGRRPYRLTSTAPGELARVVCDTDPEAPSLAIAKDEPMAPSLAAVSERRHTSPERLRAQLRGDLDAIIAMAMRKEPGRRYASAALFAQDIERYLGGRPVHAHRDTRAYRTRKFLRRHRVQVAAGLLVLLSLIVGTGAAVWQARVASEQRDLAQRSAASAEAQRLQADEVATFLFGLFEASNPWEAAADSLTARDLLERGRARVERLAGQPLVQARMLDVLARVYTGLGEYERARQMLERSLGLRRGVDERPDLETARTRLALAESYRRLGRYEDALREGELALEEQRTLLGPDDPATAPTLQQLAGLYVYRADLRRSAELAEEAVAVRERAFGPNDTLVAVSLIRLAAARRRLADYDGAEELVRRAMQIHERTVGTRHLLYADALANLGYILEDDRGRYAEAEVVFRQAYEIRLALLGSRHLQTVLALGNVASTIAKQPGRAEESMPLFRENLEGIRAALGAEHPSVAESKGHFANVLRSLGRLEESEEYARQSVQEMERAFGERHSAVGWALTNLAQTLLARNKHQEAERTLRSALEIRRNAAPGVRDSPLIGLLTAELGSIVAYRSATEAESLMVEGYRMILRHVPEGHHDASRTRELLADFYTVTGRPEEAQKYRN